MFEITDSGGQIVISLTRNDSCEISTCPMEEGDSGVVPIPLGEGDLVMFAVANRTGKIYLRKILTNADINSDGYLLLKLSPEDTADMPAGEYIFSFAYMPNHGEECYTYAVGVFDLTVAVATVKQLGGDGVD